MHIFMHHGHGGHGRDAIQKNRWREVP
jgi:hypothetical protein